MGVAPTRAAYRVPSLSFLYYFLLSLTPPTNNIASLRLHISLPPSLSPLSLSPLSLSFLLFFWGGGEEASPLPPPPPPPPDETLPALPPLKTTVQEPIATSYHKAKLDLITPHLTFTEYFKYVLSLTIIGHNCSIII